VQPGEPVIVMARPARDEIEAGVDRGAGGRRARQCGAVLDRPGLPQGGQQGALLRGYKRVVDRYKGRGDRPRADVVVWCCDEAPAFTPDRPQDKAIVPTSRAMRMYADGEPAPSRFPFNDADRIMAIGSDA